MGQGRDLVLELQKDLGSLGPGLRTWWLIPVPAPFHLSLWSVICPSLFLPPYIPHLSWKPTYSLWSPKDWACPSSQSHFPRQPLDVSRAPSSGAVSHRGGQAPHPTILR